MLTSFENIKVLVNLASASASPAVKQDESVERNKSLALETLANIMQTVGLLEYQQWQTNNLDTLNVWFHSVQYEDGVKRETLRTNLANCICKSIKDKTSLMQESVSYTHLTLPTNREV